LVDTLDQDLGLDGDDGDESKKKVTSVGLKQNIRNANKKESGDDDEVNTEEPAASEDVKEEGQEGSSRGDANASQATKLAGAIPQDEDMTQDATDVPAKKQDFPLMDMLCSFLYEDEEPLPILCGYFSKILEQMLDKQKLPTLEYLLLNQEGKIFNGLLRHLDQHSLTTLMIKLIEQQIQPEIKDKWEASDNSDQDGNDAEPELTAD
jgi:hypothetical protein